MCDKIIHSKSAQTSLYYDVTFVSSLQLFVLDFPIRHGDIPLEYQLHLKEEYHRVAAQLNVRYFSTEAFFPLCDRYAKYVVIHVATCIITVS